VRGGEWILAAAFSGALAGCGGMLIDSLVFIPYRGSEAPPPGVEERSIDAADGTRIHAWYAGGPKDAAVLLWSHGNAGNVSTRRETFLELTARGVGVLAYDYRGYGKSSGRPSESGVALDAEAAYDHLRASGVAPQRIVGFGESLGGAVTVHLASRRPLAALVLISTFPTLREVARYHYGPLGAVVGARFDSASLMPELDLPLLFVHGDRDEVVPYELGQRLYAVAGEPKRFLRIPGAYHNDVLAGRASLDAIAAFAHEVTRPG
jgi:fermentation-respiration switch protein FrsA (DUF1100 family)